MIKNFFSFNLTCENINKNVYDRFQTSKKVEDAIAICQLVEQGLSNDQGGALEAFALSK